MNLCGDLSWADENLSILVSEACHVEWSLYVKEEGHAGRTGRRRSGRGGEDRWKSGWQNRLCRERYKSEERPKERHKTREEAENGITKEGQERGEESREAQDIAGLTVADATENYRRLL